MTCRNLVRRLVIGCLVIPGLAAGRATAQSDQPGELGPKRRIYVPVEELDVVVDRDHEGVILTREEYLKLIELAKKNGGADLTSERGVAVSKAEYSAEVADDQLVLTAVIEFQQLKPGWQTILLPFRNVSVERAALDDKAARLARDSENRGLTLFSSQTGRHSLSLKLSTPLASVGSDRVAAFGLPPIPAASLDLSLPPGQYLQANDVLLERPGAADQSARYTVAIGGRDQLELRITGRRNEQQSASLVFAQTAMGLRVAHEERTWGAITTLNVFGKPVDTLEFVIPKSLEIVSIDSAGLERWEISPGPNAATTALKLVYRQPFADLRNVTFQGVSSSPIGQPWSVPTLSLTSATSHLVQIIVQAASGLRLQPVEATAVRRITAAEAAEPEPTNTVEGGQPLRYAAWREDFALLFVTQPRARELQATIATRVDVGASELDLRSSVAVQSRFAPLFDFDLVLPADWTVTEVLHGNVPASWRVMPIEAGSHQLRISFQPAIPADGRVNLTVSARRIPSENWPIEDQPLQITLPEVYLPQAGVTDGRYMVAADDDLDLSVEGLSGLTPVRLSHQEQQLARAPRLVYEYQDTRFQGALRVTRKASRLAVQTLAFHRLDREMVLSHLEARVVSQGGGLTKLELALPESAGTDLRFRVVTPTDGRGVAMPSITEQTTAEPANGARLWTLRFDQRVFGLLWLVVDIQTPRGASVTEFVFPGLTVTGADRQSGQIAVEGQTDQQLKLSATDSAGQPLKELDPADVFVPVGYVPRDRIIAAYETVRPGTRITAAETLFERLPVPTAVCDKAVLATVIGKAGSLQHLAQFQVRAIGIQSLQVELPAGAGLWATLIDNNPVEVRRAPGDSEATVYLIPFSSSKTPGTARTLQLFYDTTIEGLESTGHLRQTPPHVAVVSGDGTAQPLEILEQEWTLYHSADSDIATRNGAFETATQPVAPGLLGWLQQNVRLDTEARLSSKLIAVGAALVVVGALWLVFRARGHSGMIQLLVLGGVIVFIAMLMLPAVQQSREAARRSQAANDLRQSGLAKTEAFAEKSAPATPVFSDADRGAMPKPDASAMMGESPPPEAMSYGGQVSLSEPLNEKAQAALDHIAPAPATETIPNTFGQPLPPFGQGTRAVQRETFNRNSFPRYGSIVGLNQNNSITSDLDVPFKVGAGQAPIVDGRRQAGPNDQMDGQAPPQEEPAEGAPAGGDKLVAGAQAGDNGPDKKLPVGTHGALLSLAITLQAEPGSRQTVLRYVGSPSPTTAPVLDVTTRSRESSWLLLVAWVTGLVAVFWLMRKAPAAIRAAVVVIGILGPIALVPLAPADLLPHLDGILVGSIAGCLLWLLLYAIAMRRSLAGNPVPTAVLLLAAACGAGAGNAHAGEGEPGAAAAAQPPGKPVATPPRDTIVIPYDLSEDPLKSERVLLPFDRFLELWQAGHPEANLDVGAPADGLIAESLYSAALIPAATGGRATVEVKGRYVVHSFRNEQVTIALPLGAVSLTAATLDGADAPIVTGDGQAAPALAVVVSQSGTHVLDLTFSVPAEVTGPSGMVTLPLKPVPAGALRFTLPSADLNLKAGGTAGAYRRVREGDKTVAIVPVDRAENVTLSWSPARSRESVEGIVHVDSRTSFAFDDAGLKAQARFKYTVRQGSLQEANFSLPRGLLVRRISGLDFGGWEIVGADEQRTLKVFLRRPVNDETTLDFDLFLPQLLTDQPLSVVIPQFAPQSVTRETGLVGVSAEPQLTVAAGSAAGLTQIDTAQFDGPAIPGSVLQMAYRFATRPWQLTILASRQKAVSKGVGEHACLVTARKQRLFSRFLLQLVGAPRSELALQLPAEYLLNDLKSHDVADYYIETPPDGAPSILHLDLAAPRTGAVEFILDGFIPRPPEDLYPAVVLPEPIGIGELKSSAGIWLDKSFTATVLTSDGWKSIDPETLSPSLKQARPAPPQLAFTSNLTAVQPIALELKRATARLTPDSLTVVIVRDSSVQYAFTLRWRISLAGEDTFVFTTPDWLADRLEIPREYSGVRIRQVTTEKIAGNRLRWTITLEEPRETALFLPMEAVLPPPQNGRVEAPLIAFERVITDENGRQYQPFETQPRHVVLVNQSHERLSQELPNSAEAIPASDLPIRIGGELSNQAAEILRIRDPRAALAWTIQPSSALKALPASVNVARLTLVVASDGTWRSLAELRVNNRARQFLAVRLPAESRVLSLLVGGQPSRMVIPKREDGDVRLIPLPKTAVGDLSVEIQLTLAGRFNRPLPKGLTVLRDEFDLPSPQVLSQLEDPEFGAPVAATEWTVVLPEGIDAKRVDIPDRSNMAASAEGAERLIAQYQEMISLATIAVDNSLSMAVQSRARSNLKQLNIELNSQRSDFAEVNESQGRKLSELRSKVQSANESVAKSSAPTSGDAKASGAGGISAKAIQRDVLFNNSGEIQFFEQSSEGEELKLELSRAPDPAAAEKKADSERSKSGEMALARVKNRAALREETAQQSLQLNAGAGFNPQDASKDGKAGGGGAMGPDGARMGESVISQNAADVDADDLFEMNGKQFGQAPILGGIANKIAGAKDRAVNVNEAGQPGAAGLMQDGAVTWTTPGGLSLPVTLPQFGQKLTFSKSGGDAKLALGIRSEETVSTTVGLTWTALWFVAAIALVASLGRADALSRIAQTLPLVATIGGIVWFFVLPGAPVAFVVFVVGLLSVAWQHRRHA